MNKHLELAHKVLADSKSMMNAREIWESAAQRGYLSKEEFKTCSLPALRSALSSEVKQTAHPSAFGSSSRQHPSYFLRELGDLWGTLQEAADAAERFGSTTLLQIIRSRAPRPTPKTIAVSVYDRDPHVIAYVRLRANHHCEMCGIKGFQKDNDKRYVEVHHLKRLADGGSDIPENAVALCANCHRELHLSVNRELRMSKMIIELRAKGIDVKPC